MEPDSNERDSRTSSVHPMLVAADLLHAREQRPGIGQRFSVYFFGGALALAALYALSRQMNPPDSALKNTDMTELLGAWDGAWQGVENRYGANGELLGRSDVVRQFSSISPNVQMEDVIRTNAAGNKTTESWLRKLNQDGELTRRQANGEDAPLVMVGRRDEAGLVWNSQSPSENIVVRVSSGDGVMRVDEIHTGAEASGLNFSTSTYKRVPAGSVAPLR
ncbi:hypothetical protein BH09SUM1_BH09SUM1_16020 [soil metagenome]